jgi:fatty acid desaturase
VFGAIHTPILYLRAYRRNASKMNLSRRKRIMIWLEKLLPLGAMLAIGASCFVYGVFDLFAVAFLVPAFLSGNVPSWRKFIEHIGLVGHDWESLTRAIRPRTRLGRLVSESVLHEPYHDLHHHYPKIPYDALPAATAFADPAPGCEFDSYFAAFRDLCGTLSDPKFGSAWLPSPAAESAGRPADLRSGAQHLGQSQRLAETEPQGGA